MRFFKFIASVFKTYDYRDIFLSLFAVAIFLLMIVKMIFFPYGLFGFGESNIYTEGLVARNGIQNVNPLFVDYNEADREISRLVFSGLMKYDPAKRAIVDDMASLTINESKTEYTLEIRKGIKWHDGEDFTIDDVLFTFNDVILAPGFQNEILKTNFAGVGIEKVDDDTVRFILGSPNIFFVTNLTMGILPEHILGNVDPADILTDNFNKRPIGTGPYIVIDAPQLFPDGRMQITLDRSLGYYGELSQVEKMRFSVYPTMHALVEDVNAVNAVVKLTGDFILEFQENERFELTPYELPQYTAVFMNIESEILKDSKNVRLALQKAIDKELLISEFVDKIAVDTPLMELNQEEWVYQASIEQAQGALKDAGFNYGEEDVDKLGIRYGSDEKALELSFIARLYADGTYQADEVDKVVSFLVEKWESIGFGINVELLPDEDFRNRISNRNYDLLLVGQNLGYNLDTYSYWHSSQADPLGQNLSNYKSYQVDSLIEDVRAVFNEEKRERELREIAEKIKEDIPAIFLYRPIYFYASDGKVSGVSVSDIVFPADRFESLSVWKFER